MVGKRLSSWLNVGKTTREEAQRLLGNAERECLDGCVIYPVGFAMAALATVSWLRASTVRPS
jgi:hypothetical protein